MRSARIQQVKPALSIELKVNRNSAVGSIEFYNIGLGAALGIRLTEPLKEITYYYSSSAETNILLPNERCEMKFQFKEFLKWWNENAFVYIKVYYQDMYSNQYYSVAETFYRNKNFYIIKPSLQFLKIQTSLDLLEELFVKPVEKQLRRVLTRLKESRDKRRKQCKK